MFCHLVRLLPDFQRLPFFLLLPAAMLSCDVSPARADEPAHSDVEYARVDGQPLRLDIYQPESSASNPLIIWVHGGAWRAGSKDRMPIGGMLDHGYAIASVDYRLSTTARFPANIHDIKAAIRFLRANAKQYNLNADQFYVAGASAGGHLAALVGVSNGVRALEGTVGANGDTSSDVHAAVSFYGAANLQTILKQSTPHGLSVRVPALNLLLGGQPEKVPDLARLASPVAHVDRKDPPLMLLHGDQDPQMPINQAHELHGAYRKLNLPVRFEVIHGAAHGGSAFYDSETLKHVAEFLKTAAESR